MGYRHAAVAHLEPFEQGHQMLFDRTQADVQFARDLLIDLALAQEAQDIPLPGGQRDAPPGQGNAIREISQRHLPAFFT